MNVLIVSKTKMRNAVCVGGLLLPYNANIRLLNPGNRNQPEDTDFEIGQIWDMRFIKRNPITPPHYEDRIILEKKRNGQIENISNLIKERNLIDWTESPTELFGKKLLWTDRGTGYCTEKNGFPKQSVGFWVSDQDLELYQSYGKYRYRYSSDYHFPYVGLQNPIDKIPAGTIIRMSLTRPADVKGDGLIASWLQLSGWYENEK